jgi:hypothetical protein
MRRALLLVLIWATALAAQTPTRPTASSYLSHVRHLSSDDFSGRGNGTPELERAAEYIAGQFRAAGLAGGIGDGSFDQPFDTEVRIEPPSSSTMVLANGSLTRTFALGMDFYPLSALDRLPGAPPPIFDGPRWYLPATVSRRRASATTTAGIDVRGCRGGLTHEPQENDEAASSTAQSTPAASSRPRRAGAGARARLLLVVEDPSPHRRPRDAWRVVVRPQRDMLGIPVLRVAREAPGRRPWPGSISSA